MSSLKRLKGQNRIQRVFKEGKSVFIFPIKLIWIENIEPKFPTEMSVSIWAGKRFLRKAVDRNKVKRRIRASLQNHAQFYLNQSSVSLDCICIYVGKEVMDFKTIDTVLLKLGKRIKLPVKNI